MNVDVSELLNALGGGPGAVAILGMGAAVFLLYRRNNQLQDARISDLQMYTERTQQMSHQNVEAMSAFSDTVKELAREVRDGK